MEKNLWCREISNFYTSVMWRNLKFFPNRHVETIKILHITDVEKFKRSPHLLCGENSDFSTSVMWRNLKKVIKKLRKLSSPEFYLSSPSQPNNVYNLWCFIAFSLFCCKIYVFAIYAVLTRFTRFGMEKIGPKTFAQGEKNDKYQVWNIPRIANVGLPRAIDECVRHCTAAGAPTVRGTFYWPWAVGG